MARPAPADATVRPHAATGPGPAVDRGHFEVWTGRAGVVVTAPHGSYDTGTGAIVRDVARRTGWSAVVAMGFTRIDAERRRFSVNRPTEGRPGAGPGGERETEAARRVFAAYRRHVAEIAQGPLHLYVEVHGHAHAGTAHRIEIATNGLGIDEARAIKSLFESAQAGELAEDAPRLAIAIEGLDPLRYTALAAKRCGVLGVAPRALHIELPHSARTAHRAAYTSILAALLSRSASLLLDGPR